LGAEVRETVFEDWKGMKPRKKPTRSFFPFSKVGYHISPLAWNLPRIAIAKAWTDHLIQIVQTIKFPQLCPDILER
jgi:hypothetical protein